MQRKGVDWDSPQVQMLDLQYHDLRPEKGLYYLLERQGQVRLAIDSGARSGKLVELVEFAESLQAKHGFPVACFGHAGDGNIHVNIMVPTMDDPAVRAEYAAAWGIPVEKLDPKVGRKVTEIVGKDSPVRGLYIMGENPILSDPNTNHVREALGEIEFLVVQDIFLNETAQLAHVVLPGVSFAEKEGTFTNTERRVQRVRTALPIRGDARRRVRRPARARCGC